MKSLLSLLNGPKKKIAGLDIGASSIKFMELEGEDVSSIKLVTYATEPVPRELSSEDGNYENIEALGALVRKCWKKSGSTTKHVAIALPTSSVISKKAIIPIFDNNEDLKLQVENELSKHLPTNMPIENIGLDYYTIGRNQQVPTDNDMLLVAAKKEKIEERVAIVEAAGLIPVILEVDQFVMQNMLRMMKGQDFMEKTYVVADCSANNLRLSMFSNGQMVYSKDSSIGGFSLTQDIMLNCGLTYEEAERTKVERNGDETYDMVLKTFLNNYASEFLRAFQYFYSATGVSEVDEIVLTGGVAGLPGIEEALTNAIMETGENNIKSKPYVARPLHSTPKSNRIDLVRFTRDEPSMFLATSLALRHYLRQY